MWDRGDRAEMISTVSASLPREKRRSVPETLADSFHVQKGRVTPDSLCGVLEAIHVRDPLLSTGASKPATDGRVKTSQ